MFFLDSILHNDYINYLFVTFCVLIIINGSNFIDGMNTLCVGYYLLIGATIFYLQFNDWKSIIEWKYKQELRLRNKKKDLSLKKYLSEFIQYYEKISRWMYIKSPHDCQLLIKIDKDQKIKQIKWPQKVT